MWAWFESEVSGDACFCDPTKKSPIDVSGSQRPSHSETGHTRPVRPSSHEQKPRRFKDRIVLYCARYPNGALCRLDCICSDIGLFGWVRLDPSLHTNCSQIIATKAKGCRRPGSFYLVVEAFVLYRVGYLLHQPRIQFINLYRNRNTRIGGWGGSMSSGILPKTCE